MHLESSNIYKDEICHTLEVYTSTSKVFLRGVLLPEYFKLLCCLIKEGILLIEWFFTFIYLFFNSFIYFCFLEFQPLFSLSISQNSVIYFYFHSLLIFYSNAHCFSVFHFFSLSISLFCHNHAYGHEKN